MNTSNFSLKKYLPLLLSVFVFLVLYQWITSPLVTTITGVGEVSAKAETATVTFAFSLNGDSAKSATDSAKGVSSRIRKMLKDSGVSENDIYESSVVVLPASSVVRGAGGFQATLNMGLKTTKINEINNLVSSLYSEGAVVVTQPVLSVGNKAKLEDEAYNLALKDAKSQSTKLSLKYMKLFKKIVLVQESTTSPSSTVTSKADSSPDDGMIKISKVLSVSYKLW